VAHKYRGVYLNSLTTATLKLIAGALDPRTPIKNPTSCERGKCGQQPLRVALQSALRGEGNLTLPFVANHRSFRGSI